MTTAPAAVRSLLFDLGGTLWELGDPAAVLSEESAAAVSAGATLRAFLSPDVPEWDDLARGRALRDHFIGALRSAYAAEPSLEPDFASLTLGALRSMGIDRATERWGAVLYEALRVRSVHTRVLFPDVLSTLDVLRQRGYTFGVVTNRAFGGSIFLDDMRQMGLLQFFEPRHIAVSADLGYRKPYPAIFRHAMEGLGQTAQECAMIGDNPGADMSGARQLGMFTVWRPRTGEAEKPAQVAPDAVISQIADLLALFPSRR